ncbi:MAG: tRNA (adenosine(37)-N6)-threonylcarbamoyltransferase complex dimerization subunit type 1 TsaB [Burkholderiales bacterium]|nr:tRNA (adenosine(37)-N6)-threonylcarbamoyltransferase complex dimerization subunit type 1 TsaB [Burkholderiales bacterium]
MTRILAIETTTGLASVALLDGEQGYVRELPGVQTHSQGVLPAVQSLLAEAGVALADCDAIAFGCGPGAFTGIRTACGIVQGLAYGAGLPVLPVVSLLAMAQAAREQQGGSEFVCVLDARMSEVYWAQYRYAAGGWQTVVEPLLSRPDEIPAALAPDLPLFVLGQGLDAAALPPSTATLVCMPHALQVARLGRAAYEAGVRLSAEQAQPLYLRNKIALTTAERMQLKPGR